MKIGFVTVFVTDLRKSLAFYTNILEMEIDYSDDKNWAALKSGDDVSLGLEACETDHVVLGSKVVGRFVGVTLMVDDILQTYEQLAGKGVEFTGKPEKQWWGGVLAHFRDPDGNILTLMEEATSVSESAGAPG